MDSRSFADTDPSLTLRMTKNDIFMKTPVSERLHIAVLGARNSGKSSLVNAIAGHTVSLVSEIPGTTADPVSKAMEIPGTGAVVFIDTAGFDDEGELGELRVERTGKSLDRTDIAILLFRDGHRAEETNTAKGTLHCREYGNTGVAGIYREWYRILSDREIPVIPVLNVCKTDNLSRNTGEAGQETALELEIERLAGLKPVTVNAATGEGIDAVFAAIASIADEKRSAGTITGDLVKPGDTVLLVMPQDSEAPKGRLILPQVQTIRELLDKGCTAVCCTPETMPAALGKLAGVPDLIITDSQAFGKVWESRPEGCRVTSFSILFAAYKGDVQAFIKGAEALDRLAPGSHILIAEACSHAPASEDIGRVKIPEMLKRRFGDGLQIDTVSGNDFPANLSGYDLVIHCGACMFNRRYVLNRVASALKQGIPITNYGMTIAWATGILDKVALPGR